MSFCPYTFCFSFRTYESVSPWSRIIPLGIFKYWSRFTGACGNGWTLVQLLRLPIPNCHHSQQQEKCSPGCNQQVSLVVVLALYHSTAVDIHLGFVPLDFTSPDALLPFHLLHRRQYLLPFWDFRFEHELVVAVGHLIIHFFLHCLHEFVLVSSLIAS